MVNEISISKRDFRSKFRSHKQSVGNFVRNFAPTCEISNEFCHLQQICQVKFRTSARNFVNGETIEASEISPKIRSPEISQIYVEFRRTSSKFDEIRYHYFCTVLYVETKNYNRKIQLCRFAYPTYSKIVTDLPSYLRGCTIENMYENKNKIQ